jgi:hypothetical protein
MVHASAFCHSEGLGWLEEIQHLQTCAQIFSVETEASKDLPTCTGSELLHATSQCSLRSLQRPYDVVVSREISMGAENR